MCLGCRQAAQRGTHGIVREAPTDDACQTCMSDLAREELEEAVELVGIAPQRRSELRGIRLWRRLDPVLPSLAAITVNETCAARCTYRGD